jgi:hypothetical protein
VRISVTEQVLLLLIQYEQAANCIKLRVCDLRGKTRPSDDSPRGEVPFSRSARNWTPRKFSELAELVAHELLEGLPLWNEVQATRMPGFEEL